MGLNMKLHKENQLTVITRARDGYDIIEAGISSALVPSEKVKADPGDQLEKERVERERGLATMRI